MIKALSGAFFKRSDGIAFWTLVLLFLVGLGISLYFEAYWYILVPLLLGFVVLALLAYDKVLFILVFLTPLSVVLDSSLGLSFALPTEPLAFGLMLLFWIKVLTEGKIDAQLLKHPFSILVGAHLFWMLFTSISSTMPMVSLKAFLLHFWNVSVFYLMMNAVIKEKDNALRMLWTFILPLAAVILYALYRHAVEGFTHQGSGWVYEPFFIDHGVYGATIAFCIPFLAIYFLRSSVLTKRDYISLLIIPLLGIFVIGLIFSYTRAAWISVFASLCFFFVLYFKIRLRTLLITFLILVGGFLAFQDNILMELNRNKTDSGQDFGQQIKSISNVRTDASNLERLNRWYCAARMFEEKPLLGWGPGTYQFQYAPFQKPHQMTVISTNMHTLGGVHSEYFGPLVESGFPGFIIFFLMILFLLNSGMRAYHRGREGKDKLVVLIALLGLITYLSHGVLNNYLDQDKTATLFWMMSSIVVAYDLRSQKNEAGVKSVS